MKKQTPVSYPAPHAGFTNALAAVEVVVEKMNRYATTASLLPAELQALTDALTEAERQLAEADARALAGEGVADIAALEVTASNATTACARCVRQSDALEAMGAALITEHEGALAALAIERAAYVNALRDDLAERILASARDLAGHRAAYEAFFQAAALPGQNSAWLTLAHVSDPREALLLGAPGAHYDRATNLLTQTGPETDAAVKAIRAALVPLEAAKRLARIPRPQSLPASQQNRSN